MPKRKEWVHFCTHSGSPTERIPHGITANVGILQQVLQAECVPQIHTSAFAVYHMRKTKSTSLGGMLLEIKAIHC